MTGTCTNKMHHHPVFLIKKIQEESIMEVHCQQVNQATDDISIKRKQQTETKVDRQKRWTS